MRSRTVLPLAVLSASLAGAALLMATSSTVEGRPKPPVLRSVRVVPVEARAAQLMVRSQGTVVPRTESELIPEVSGPVVWTSPGLVSGGYFAAGEPLLRIERADYEAAVERARAVLARAQGEHAHAQAELGRQQSLAEREYASRAALQNAQRAAQVAQASLREARLLLEQAERDLERTEIRAPFRGRVRDERVDLGQFLNRGSPFATVYATDYLEVRLPVPDDQLAYLEVPLWRAGQLDEADLPPVTLRARFAGAEQEWQGKIVRTEGEIDPKSRMVHVVARVEIPEADAQPPGVPLPVGLFVQAEIEGRSLERAIAIPRSALHSAHEVLVVDPENRLRIRRVDVLRADRDQVLIRSGLDEGERLCVSEIQNPVDGLEVRPIAAVGAGA